MRTPFSAILMEGKAWLAINSRMPPIVCMLLVQVVRLYLFCCIFEHVWNISLLSASTIGISLDSKEEIN